jgi:hypothetical protein
MGKLFESGATAGDDAFFNAARRVFVLAHPPQSIAPMKSHSTSELHPGTTIIAA